MPRMPYPHCDQSCQNKPVQNASDNIKLKILEDKLRNDLVQKDLTDLPEVSEIKSSDYLYVYDSEQEQVKKISANEILNQVDLEDYAKKEDLAGYAEKEHSHEEYLTEHQDLTDYAKKEELFNKDYNELVNKPELFSGNYDDLINKPVIPNVDGLATEQFVNDLISKIEIPETDLSDYYNKSAIDDIIENIELKEGPAGKDGKDGEKGQSAYELWLALGNTGTEADFVTSLKGQDGEKGDNGHTPIITIQNGYWYIDGVNSNILAEGIKGETGNGISSIQKTHTEGLVDTYTITFTNGDTTTFTVTNGKDGEDGVNGKDGLTTAIKVGEITYTHENGIITLPQYIEEIPDEYITETELEAKNYLTSLPEHTHSYNDLADTPKNISAFNNDAGYLTEHQSLDNYYTKDDANAAFMTQDEVDARVNKVIADASNTETITNLTTLVDYLDTHGAEATKMAEAIINLESDKADNEHSHSEYALVEHDHEGEVLYPSTIHTDSVYATSEISLGTDDETMIQSGFLSVTSIDGGSIVLDANNDSYLINGSDIATKKYVDNTLANTKIGIDFTTNIAVGHLAAGTKISKDQTIQEILYNILFKPTYDVKFIVDGTEYKTINVMQGEKVTKPMNPNKAGYEFKGWYTDETYSTPYNFNNKIMSETSIYALFEEITTVQVQYIECCEPDGDILVTAYSQELQKGQLVPMPSIDTIRERITDGWEWDGNFYFDRECTEYFDFENTYVTSDLHIYLKITQLPEGPIIPEGSVVEEIVTNNIPAYSGSTSNGETEVTYQLLDGNTAEPTEQGFYTITDENNEVVQAGYQLTMEGNTNMDAQVFAVPLNASMVKAWQYDEMGKTWLEYDFPGDYWRAGEIITKTVDGTEIEYQTYYYNVEDIGDAISSDEYWRFEMEVNN